jgi:hypothetical protein
MPPKRKITPLPEEEVKVPLLIGKKPITLKKRPIIANVKAAPLVEAPPRNNIARKTVRRRPVPVNDVTSAPVTAPRIRKKPVVAKEDYPSGGVPETKGDD